MPDTNPSDPIIMPGPQFGQDGQNEGWFRRNSQKIIISLIVALLGLSGFYLYKNYQQRQNALRPTIESLSESPAPSNEPEANNIAQATNTPSIAPQPSQKGFNLTPATSATPPPSIKNPATKNTAPAVTAAPEVTIKGAQFTAKAQKGNGATHLARQVLKEYLKDKQDLNKTLKPEQKIYIEDYLRKHTSSTGALKIGSEISFDENQIKNAVDSAQKLTDAQIKNLHKYVLLVPSLQ